MNEAGGLMKDMERLKAQSRIITEITKELEAGGLKLASGEIALLQKSVDRAMEEKGSEDAGKIKERAEEIFFEKLECVREKELKKCFQTEDEKKLAERVYRSLIHSLEKSVLKITTRDIMTLGNIVRDVVREAGEIKEAENHFECETECLARFQNALMDEIGMEGGRSSYIADKDKRHREKEEILFRFINEYRKKQEMI